MLVFWGNLMSNIDCSIFWKTQPINVTVSLPNLQIYIFHSSKNPAIQVGMRVRLKQLTFRQWFPGLGKVF